MLAWLKKLFTGEKGVENKEVDDQKIENKESVSLKTATTKFPGVVVGKIMEINNHPNADRLKLTKINIGQESLDIICGGPNIVVGQLVPVALIGAKLPNGMEMKPAEIRGVKSFGMICAEDELGLSDGHEEVMILKPEAVIGGPIDDYIN